MSAARILDVTEAQYHADPCERPSLSHSIAHVLIAESPAHAFLQHPRLGGGPAREPSDAMIEGALLHRLMLGAGPEIQTIKADNYRTKAAQGLRDQALIAGVIPVLEAKYMRLMSVAETLRAKCADSGYPLDGKSEVAIEWTEDGVLCRCKVDHIREQEVVPRYQIIDIKKLANCNPVAVERQAYTYGYDMQAAAYNSAIEALYPKAVDDVEFVFLACEAEPPYSVVPIHLDGYYKRLGEQRWKRALQIWTECMATGKWPSYPEAWISPPSWAEMVDETA